MQIINKETIFIASLVLIVIIGIVFYDYQVRKMFAETIKRIATMDTLKKVAKSPLTALAFIWGFIWSKED